MDEEETIVVREGEDAVNDANDDDNVDEDHVVDASVLVGEEDHSVFNHPVFASTTEDERQFLKSDEEEENLGSSSRTAVVAAVEVDMQEESQQHQDPIGWDDDLCRPIYYSQKDNMVVSSEGDDDNEDDDSDNRNNDDDKATSEINAPLAFVSVPKKSRKKQRTYGDRQAVRRPFSLVLSQYEVFSPASSSSMHELNTEKKRTILSKAAHPMNSLAALASPSNGQTLTTQQTRRCRVSTSPTVPDEKQARSTDMFLFDTNKSISCYIEKKKVKLEQSLNRERAFFEDLDKSQKLRVENAAVASPLEAAGVVPDPVLLRAPKFVFRPNLQKETTAKTR